MNSIPIKESSHPAVHKFSILKGRSKLYPSVVIMSYNKQLKRTAKKSVDDMHRMTLSIAALGEFALTATVFPVEMLCLNRPPNLL